MSIIVVIRLEIMKKIKERLEYLRGEIRKECISYGEIAELQSLAKHIEKDDVELLQWVGDDIDRIRDEMETCLHNFDDDGICKVCGYVKN